MKLVNVETVARINQPRSLSNYGMSCFDIDFTTSTLTMTSESITCFLLFLLTSLAGALAGKFFCFGRIIETNQMAMDQMISGLDLIKLLQGNFYEL